MSNQTLSYKIPIQEQPNLGKGGRLGGGSFEKTTSCGERKGNHQFIHSNLRKTKVISTISSLIRLFSCPSLLVSNSCLQMDLEDQTEVSSVYRPVYSLYSRQLVGLPFHYLFCGEGQRLGFSN